MSQTTLWILIAISTSLAIFLLFHSLRSWKKIKQLETMKTDIEKQQEQSLKDMHLNAMDSIKVIAQCMIDEQVDLSEGSIRIKVLLDHVAPELNDHPTFNIFSKMYVATEHMPTHEARKQADKKLIKKLDAERFKLEEENKEKIIHASKELINTTLIQ